jgi:two-component system cell cycle response regulator
MSSSGFDSAKTQALGSDVLGESDMHARTATLVVIQGPEIGRGFRLEADRTILGRSSDATIRITDASLSRNQCAFLRGGESGYLLRDLGSTNGTWVNGKRVEEYELANDDTIQAGNVVLKFSFMSSVESGYHAEMSTRVRRDPLTGLLNLRAFYEELDAALVLADLEERPIGFTMLDIDGLKGVNDRHGHLLGAAVVRGVGMCLREVAQARDGVAALYGGDEFSAFVVGADEPAMCELGEAARSHVEATPMSTANTPEVHVSVCVGVSVTRPSETDRNALVQRADVALYAAKRSGKNRVVPYREELEG